MHVIVTVTAQNATNPIAHKTNFETCPTVVSLACQEAYIYIELSVLLRNRNEELLCDIQTYSM